MRITHLRLLACLLPLLALPAPAPADNQPDAPDYHRIFDLRIRDEGNPDPAAWQHLTDGQQAQAVTKLKDYAGTAQKAEHLKMHLTESPHFLIYADSGMAPNLVHQDTANLESAYGTLCRICSVKAEGAGQGLSIWQGKALFFVFSDADLADDFLATTHPHYTPPARMMQTFPVLTRSGDGRVEIVAVQPDALRNTMRDIVMGMADAFLFRLRSPTPVASWVESGLSLAIADSIHYQGTGYSPSDADIQRNAKTSAAYDLHNQDINRFLGQSEPNPMACEALIDLLVAQSPTQMGKFVVAMKDGKNWEDALKDAYHLTPEELKTGLLNSSRQR